MPTITDTLNQKILRITDKIISNGLPILYFLIATAFYLRTYDSAQIKITLVHLGGVILFTTWLIKIIEEDSLPYFRKNLIIIFPIIAFLVSGIVSTAGSPFPLASTNELVRRIMYAVFALIIIKEFDSESKLKVLFNWLIAATFVSVIYGVIQYLDYNYFPPPPGPGLDPFIWRGAFSDRIFSTFGNPNFFGDFLVVMGPIVLALFLRTKQFYLLILWFGIGFCVVQTVSKGAWLGYAAGIIIFAFLYVGFFLHAKKAKVRRIILFSMMALLLIAGVGIVRQMGKRPDSGSFRLFTWVSTWEMIKTSPWFGTGLGTFYVTYPSWRRPQIFFIEGRHNTETDHPENEYLEVWYDEGLVGFGLFLLLLSVYLSMAFQNLKVFSKINISNSKVDIRAYYHLGILSALLAQLVHNAVCVSLRFVSSGVMLWLLLGLIGALNANQPLSQKSLNSNSIGRIPLVPRRILQVVILLLAVYFGRCFYGYFQADVHHNMAIFFSKQGQWEPALDHYNTIMEKNPSFIMSHYFMGNVYNDRWGPGDPDRSIKKYEDVWQLAPNYVQSHHQAGLIFLKWGGDEKRLAEEAAAKGDKKGQLEHERNKIEKWNRALSEFARYREIDPIFPLNYYRIAWIYMQLDKPDEAEKAYLDHVEFPDKLAKPPYDVWVEDWAKRRYPEYSETYINLGNLSFMRNDFTKGEKYYKKAIEYNPKSVNALKNLAILYGRQGKMQDATDLWNKLRLIVPKDPDVLQVFSGKR